MKLILRRKKFIVKKNLQFRYTLNVLVMMFFVAVVVSYTLTYSFLSALATPEIFLKVLGKNLIITGIVVTFIIIVFCIFFSHRIAGPLYRFEKYLEGIGESNFTQKEIKIRKNDELQELAQELNKMTKALRELITEDKKILSIIEISIDELKEIIKADGPLEEKLFEIEKRLIKTKKNCQKLISKYKI